MSFLQRLQRSQSLIIDSWKNLTDHDQLDVIDSTSFDYPVIIFKHSTTCGISASAKFRLERDWSMIERQLEFYYLDLLKFRGISNVIAERYEVRHESPQILVIKEGRILHHSSHYQVSIPSLKEYI